MKKLIFLGLFFVALNADFLRVEAGAGLYNSEVGGDVRYGGNDKFDIKDEFGLSDKSTQAYAWIMVKHFLPLIPNARIETFNFMSDGKAEKNVSWGGTNYTANAKTKFNLRQTDLIAYYNILDNTLWITIDLGLDIRLFRGEFEVGNEKAKADFALPLVYARARVNVPSTGLGVEADVKFVSYDGSSISDISAKLDYVFGLGPVDLGVEFGYKMQKFTLDTSSADIKGDIDLKGIFAGVVAKF